MSTDEDSILRQLFPSFCSRFFPHTGLVLSSIRDSGGAPGAVGPQRAPEVVFSALASPSPEISAGTTNGRMGDETPNHSVSPFLARTPVCFGFLCVRRCAQAGCAPRRPFLSSCFKRHRRHVTRPSSYDNALLGGEAETLLVILVRARALVPWFTLYSTVILVLYLETSTSKRSNPCRSLFRYHSKTTLCNSSEANK